MNLKPITIVNAHYSRYRQNTTQQILLLKALKITRDPEKLRQIIGVRKVADVFRTLDKMAMRKEFHQALIKRGIDFEYIVKGLQDEVESADKSSDRIKVYEILLRSLGMDKYEDIGDAGSSPWEETLIRKIEEEKKEKLASGNSLLELDGDYKVEEPFIPEEIQKKQKNEKDIGKSLYE